MSEGIQFNETRIAVGDVSSGGSSFESGMIKLVTKLSGGFIKNDNQARYAIVVLAIIIFIVSIYLFVGPAGGSSAPNNLNILPAE